MNINLVQVEKTLETEIQELEQQIAPLQKKLQEKRERLVHVKALLPINNREPSAVASAEKKISWAVICRQHNWPIKNDSAHRVVQRQDPKLHDSIQHHCVYDGRTYP